MKHPLKTLLTTWFLSMLAIHLLQRFQFITVIQQYSGIITCFILIYVPLTITWKWRPPIPLFEKNFLKLTTSLKFFGIISLIIFPVMLGLNHYFQAIAFHRTFHYNPEWFSLIQAFLYHLLMVAIPEEFFYRSYMQTVLNKHFSKSVSILGIQLGYGLLLTSLLFALSHSLVSFAWWHFSIFFPSLVFGWLRDKTESITASSLFHALSNVFSMWVAMNYR